MRIFLTGATGYVGQAVMQTCIEQGHEIVCLVRPGWEKKLNPALLRHEQVTFAKGDVLDPESLINGMAPCDSIIHLVGIIREFPKREITFEKLHILAIQNIIAAAKQLGIKRYVHMSALGARIGSLSGYSNSKGIAEDFVKESGLDWTIFRPSVIFGPHDEFVNMLADMIQKTPVVPIIGSGEYQLQPVALQNVAIGFATAMTRPETIGKIYDIGGPESYTYNRMIDEISSAIGKKRKKLHIPLALMLPIIRMMEGFPFFPITRPQLTMLLEGNTCDPRDYYKTFNIQPISFSEGIRQYLG